MHAIQYSENNSGGRWWLAKGHYDALMQEGWEPDYSAYKTLPRAMNKVFSGTEREALAEAMRDWMRATGLDAGEVGCPCCGPPHQFMVWE